MAENKDINAFAREYLALFTDQKTQERMLAERFGEQSQALGFVMDGGRGFVEEYSGDAYDNTPDLLKIIGSVTDPMLLGSAIYSRWRYITRWSGESLLDEANRSWFVAALGRLEDMTRPRYAPASHLTGSLKMVQLISNNRSSGKRPTVNEQIEQQVTIRDDGTTSLSVADYQADPRGHKVIRTMPNISMPREDADRILHWIAANFRYAYAGSGRDFVLRAEPGMWKLILTDTEGRTYTTAGPLGSHFPAGGADLSDQIRSALENYDLLLFDGNPDLVNRLEVRYRSGHRDPENPETVLWTYLEQITFDRRTESAEHILESTPGLRVRNSYYIHDGVASFLDTINERSFSGIQGNSPDIYEDPAEEIRGYEIAVYTRKGRNRVIRGSYDKRSLPREWDVFIDQMLTFLSFYGFGQIFDAERYATTRRRRSDHVYLSVVFEEGNGEHVYLAEDDSNFHVDDFVMVPVGSDNTPTMAQIVSIIYGSTEEAPRPYQTLKKVIRKSTQDDFRLLQTGKEQEPV